MSLFTKRLPKAVYIHIPFCTNKCHYCDFNSYVLKGQPVSDYLDALEREIEMTVKQAPPQEIKTIFVGGGTPTVLEPMQMDRFLSIARSYFPIQPDMEFTMEANPGTTELEKLQVMKEGGVNRISFGVQSFDNHLLETIGRIHDVDDVFRSIEQAKRVGFDNLSIDLMFGLPNQTLAMLEHSLDQALQLQLQHYSIYGLKIEENTLFYRLYQKDQLPLPEEDEEFNMYVLVMDRLQQAGFSQYEISNFALKGKESKHNTAYWANEFYYGFGAGAHGYLNGVRHVNIKGVQHYIDAAKHGFPRLEERTVEEEEAMEDFMMVGLRMLQGVKSSDFAKQFGRPLEDIFGTMLRSLIEQKLLQQTESGYRLSKKGVMYGNDVFGSFVGSLVSS